VVISVTQPSGLGLARQKLRGALGGQERTKTSPTPFVSPGTRFVEMLSKTTCRPSEETDARWLSQLPPTPVELVLARVVVPVTRSCRKTSQVLLVSERTRLLAALSKVMNRPSAEIDGHSEVELDCTPVDETLMRVVVPSARSRTKMSGWRFVSPGTRFSAPLWNPTKRPSAEMAGTPERPSGAAPEVDTLTSSVLPLARSCTKMPPKAFAPGARTLVRHAKATKRPS
jgi:hypothetical protein